MKAKVRHKTFDEITTVKAMGKKFLFNPGTGMLFDERFDELGKARIGRTKHCVSVFV
jgi:hypothetical protein